MIVDIDMNNKEGILRERERGYFWGGSWIRVSLNGWDR